MSIPLISQEQDLLPIKEKEIKENLTDLWIVFNKFMQKKEFKDFIEDLLFQLLEFSFTEHVISVCSIQEESKYYQKIQIFWLCGLLLKLLQLLLQLHVIQLILLEEE